MTIPQAFTLRWLQFFRNFLPTVLFDTTYTNLSDLQAGVIGLLQIICAFIIPLLLLWSVKKFIEVML